MQNCDYVIGLHDIMGRLRAEALTDFRGVISPEFDLGGEITDFEGVSYLFFWERS